MARMFIISTVADKTGINNSLYPKMTDFAPNYVNKPFT